MKRFHLILLVSVGVLTGCVSGGTGNPLEYEPLSVHPIVYKKSIKVCDEPDADSLQMEISSIAIEFIPKGLMTDSLEEFIREHTLTMNTAKETAGDAEVLFNAFAQDFGEVVATFGGPCQGWTLSRKLECLLNGGGLFSVSALDFSYTGGAHPNTVITLQTYDLTTGQPVDVLKTIDAARTDAFLASAEKGFRVVHGIADTASWESAGFWFDKGFTLPENMAFTPDGLLLVYNAYEVAPYSTGSTEIMIPAAELVGFLTTEWEGRFLNLPNRD